MNLTQIIGENIKLARIEKGMKQEILARQIGITKGRLSQIENGCCEGLTISRINKIASCLDVSPFEILGKLPSDSIEQYKTSNSIYMGDDSIGPKLIKSIVEEVLLRLNRL